MGEGQEDVNGNDDRVDVEVGKVTGSEFVRAQGWDDVMRVLAQCFRCRDIQR